MRGESEMNIIRMAEEAGFGANQRATLRLKLKRFAALVAAAEREACEKICVEEFDAENPYIGQGKACADAIRERGEEWEKACI